MNAIGWLITAVSLIGVLMNIHHDRRCFIVWGITNAGWCAIDWHAGIYSQAALQAVYFVLSAYGWWKWKRRTG